MTFPCSPMQSDPVAFRAIANKQLSNSSPEDILHMLRGEIEPNKPLTHTFSSMFKSIIEDDQFLWFWNKNFQQQIPFLHLQEENFPQSPINSFIRVSYLVYNNPTGANARSSIAIAKVWSFADTHSPCVLEFSASAKAPLIPIVKSLLLSQGKSLTKSGSCFEMTNTNLYPRFDANSFYPARRISSKLYEVTSSNLLHYRVDNFVVGLKIVLSAGDHNNELTHFCTQNHGYIYLPSVILNFSNFRLVVQREQSICDSIDFSVVHPSRWDHCDKIPNTLSNLCGPNVARTNQFVSHNLLIDRQSFSPAINPSCFIHSIPLACILQFSLLENIRDSKAVVYNEHTKETLNHLIQGKSCHVVLPEGFSRPGHTLRLYIYCKAYPVDEIYFLAETPSSSSPPISLPQSPFHSPKVHGESKLMINAPHIKIPPIRNLLPKKITKKDDSPPANIENYEDDNDKIDDVASSNEYSSPDDSMFDDPAEELLLVSRYGMSDRFESNVLNDAVVGKVVISLLIRRKRRGQWFTTNVHPQRIGKMRKCHLQLVDFKQYGTVVVESSNAESIKISQWGKSSSDGSNRVRFSAEEIENSQIQFFIVPVSGARTSCTITISIVFKNTSVTIHEWELMVANHKYESSSEGITQSKINQTPVSYYLFSDENNNVTGSRIESESQVIDSLYLLKDFVKNKH